MLIQRSSTHQLVQKSVKQYIKYLKEQGEHKVIEAEPRLLEIVEGKLSILAEKDFRSIENWQGKIKGAESYIPQAIELLSNTKDSSTKAKIYGELGVYYKEVLINYNTALEYYHKALDISKEVLGKRHHDTNYYDNMADIAYYYNKIGMIYSNQGKYNEALEYKQKALEIRKAALPENHPNIASSYNNIGVTYDSQGNYDKALEYHNKALEIREAVLPEKHPDIANSYNNIGCVYDAQGNYEKALGYYNKALEIRQATLPKNHPDIADSYNNMGITYGNQGNCGKALEYYQKALEINKAALPENHPNIASSYNNIGVTYDDQGNYEKALEYYNKALEIRKIILHENHPDIVRSYDNIGITRDSQGKYHEALEHKQKALEIRKAVLPSNDPDLAHSYDNIGITYDNQGNYGKALEYYHKALAVRLTALPEDDRSITNSYNKLHIVYNKLGLHKEEKELLRRKEGNSNEAIKPNFDPSILQIELQLQGALLWKGVLPTIYSLAEEGEWDKCYLVKPGIKSYFNDEYLEGKLGKFKSQGNLKVAKMLILKYICMAIVHNDMKHMEVLLSLASEHKNLVIQTAQEHPDYFIEKTNIRILQAAHPTDREYQAILKQALESNEEVDKEEELADDVCYSDLKHSKDDEEEDGAFGGGSGSGNKYSTCPQKTDTSSSSNEEDGASSKGGDIKTSKTQASNYSPSFAAIGNVNAKSNKGSHWFSIDEIGGASKEIEEGYDINVIPNVDAHLFSNGNLPNEEVEARLKETNYEVGPIEWALNQYSRLEKPLVLFINLHADHNAQAQSGTNWVLAFVIKDEGGKVHARLVNPMGRESEYNANLALIQGRVNSFFGGSQDVTLEYLNIQTDGDNCGPWVLYMLEQLRGASSIEEVDGALEAIRISRETNIEQKRAEYLSMCKTEAGEEQNRYSDDENDGDGYSTDEDSCEYLSADSNSDTDEVGSGSDSNTQQGGSSSETPPSKSALLAVIEEIESHGALIHDERLKVQLEHYAKTGIIYKTLAPYVEAAEAAHPSLFIENAIQDGTREEQQGNRVHITQELMDKIVGSIAERAGITYDEKLAAQAQHFVNTGNIYDTLHAYLYPQRVIEGMQQREAEEQVHEYNQTNTTTCATEVRVPASEQEVPIHTDFAS